MLRTRPCLVLLLAAVLGSGAVGAEEDPRPWAAQPFLGLSVRDTEHGLVVSWIAPGPLGGRGFSSAAGIRRGDNVVSVDGEARDAAGFKAHVAAQSPGDEIVLVTRRSPEASDTAAVPRGGPGGEAVTRTVVLGSRDEWSGTIGRGLGARTLAPPEAGEFEALLREAAGALDLREGLPGVGGGLDRLLAYLGDLQEEALDPNALEAVVNAFRRPLSVDRVEARVAAGARRASSGDLGEMEGFVRSVLGLADPAETIRELMEKEPDALTEAERRSMIRFAGQHLAGYLTGQPWRRQMEQLIGTLRLSVTIYDDLADQHVHTIREVAGPRVDILLALPLVLWRLAPAAWAAEAARHVGGPALKEVPAHVREAVQGDVLWVGEDPFGNLAVVGGPGPNRYDMRRIGAVHDVGGDDHYRYPAFDGSPAVPLRLVVDEAGDDVHEAQGPFEGPATAVLGFSHLDDRAGNDRYVTQHAFGVGAGALGFGVLLDRAGDDRYEATGPESGWGLGAGFYGGGLIVDLSGHDVYLGEKLVQGVGGPRGFGAILDVSGNDRYAANGPNFGSAYGTPGVYLGMSQGFGIGVRGYAAGGLGALYDFAGHDRYEAGEFSQAGGYFWGMGILHDAAGNDLYYGNRYGQAFAAHQAVGVLVDDAGDDQYWSMTAASQAGTWDQSIGLLLDRKGNDSYRCDGLGQGAAAMQALAILIDLEGDDRYTGRGAVQGQGGDNAYHYDADRVFSFSALVDLGGGHDAYSEPRENGTTKALGAHDPARPSASTLYGLFLDR